MTPRPLHPHQKARVTIAIVTYNSHRFIRRCLEAVFSQTGVNFDVIVVDNGSSDGTREELKRFAGQIRTFYNEQNLGFAAAQNQAIAQSSADWVLTLNPDALLLPEFLERLLEAGQADPAVGSVCGRLLSIGSDLRPSREPRIDSTGIYFTPALRHFDRGWNEPDNGQYGEMEYVFGASGAAALYRREMIEDISDGAHFFDPDFFAYREDADVAWRAQLLGWRCLYVPDAKAYHVRSVVASNRHTLPAFVNMHSVKNRFLMRIKNMTGGVYRRFWLSATLRDVVVVGGCVLFELRSLPAFWHVGRCLRNALRQRRAIMSRRRVTDEVMARWFCTEPSTEPIGTTRKRLREAALHIN